MSCAQLPGKVEEAELTNSDIKQGSDSDWHVREAINPVDNGQQMQEKIRKTVFQHQSSGNCYLDFSALALLTLFWPRLLWRVIIYCGSLVTVHEETTGCWLTVPLVLKSENFAQLSISTCPWHRCVSTEDLFSTAALPGFFSHWCSWPLPSHPPLHLTRSLYWLNA